MGAHLLPPHPFTAMLLRNADIVYCLLIYCVLSIAILCTVYWLIVYCLLIYWVLSIDILCTVYWHVVYSLLIYWVLSVDILCIIYWYIVYYLLIYLFIFYLHISHIFSHWCILSYVAGLIGRKLFSVAKRWKKSCNECTLWYAISYVFRHLGAFLRKSLQQRCISQLANYNDFLRTALRYRNT